jgi:hypothetical protein
LSKFSESVISAVPVALAAIPSDGTQLNRQFG